MNQEARVQQIIAKLKELYPDPPVPLNYSNPWELYVAVVLSARNTDKNVNNVTEGLFKKYRSIEQYRDVSFEEFDQDIRQIGLHRAKTKAIREAAGIVLEQHDGNLPDTMESLTALPGVGRKTANVLLGILFGKSEGITVDTHVTRLARLFGLTTQKYPEKIERDLMTIIPKEEWLLISLRLIHYGRDYCPAHCKHTDCPLREFIVVH